ncbi:sodium:solute symporter family transporter, partial [Clostridium sediminicola]
GFVYTPALVLSEITGLSFKAWVPIIVVFAIIYTAVGGIKAVIWTDAIQALVLFAGLVFAVIFASSQVPTGFSGIMQAAKEADKLKSFDWLFNKDSLNMWTVMIGGFAMWIGYFGFDQGQV